MESMVSGMCMIQVCCVYSAMSMAMASRGSRVVMRHEAPSSRKSIHQSLVRRSRV